MVPTIGIAYTFDFKSSSNAKMLSCLSTVTVCFSRRKIDGKYAMLSRPSDNGHTPFGDIYISYSPDMKYWGVNIVA